MQCFITKVPVSNVVRLQRRSNLVYLPCPLLCCSFPPRSKTNEEAADTRKTMRWIDTTTTKCETIQYSTEERRRASDFFSRVLLTAVET